MLSKAFEGLFPYDKMTKPVQQTQSKAEFYAECFKQLKEMNKRRAKERGIEQTKAHIEDKDVEVSKEDTRSL